MTEIVDGYTIYKFKVLGEGNYAKVYRAINNQTGDLCAVKIQKQELEDAVKEKDILQRISDINSDHLMKLLHYKVIPGKCVYLFLE